MLWDLVQVLDILLDQFGCSVVVVQHRQYAVDNGVVCLPEADVDAEDCVDDGEDEAVDEVPDGGSDALLVVEANGSVVGGGWGGVFGGLGGKIGSEHLLALGD